MDFALLRRTYADRRVLVTGHTGFKGAWLAEWLLALGAEVHGLALSPEHPSLFKALGLGHRLSHRVIDVRDGAAVAAHVRDLRPELLFHLAAQPLVRRSYREPAATFATNVQGAVNVLDALRTGDFPCTVVVVTSDKCYENRALPDAEARAFREADPLGGHDPYSASKAAAEIVAASYRDSFFSRDPRIALATARAGNVIGGGDWAEDRLVPDVIRALAAGRPIAVRQPAYTRPWQHVLEPLGGYLLLAARLDAARRIADTAGRAQFAGAFNFGPEPSANRSVGELVDEILTHWPGVWEKAGPEPHLPEAPVLSLDIAKARDLLDWRPRWSFARTVAETAAWYRAVHDGADARARTQAQIAAYTAREIVPPPARPPP